MRELQKITLRELLPPSIANAPDILAAAEAIDAELRKTTNNIPNVAIIARIYRAYEAIQANPNISDDEIAKIITSELVDLKAWEWHVDFYEPDMSLKKRVTLVAKSLDWHTRKGTPSAVEEVVTAVFSDGQVVEWWNYNAPPYHFKVNIEMPISDEKTLRTLIDAIMSVKNTRSWCDCIEITYRADLLINVGLAIEQQGTTSIYPDVPVPNVEHTTVHWASFIKTQENIEIGVPTFEFMPLTVSPSQQNFASFISEQNNITVGRMEYDHSTISTKELEFSSFIYTQETITIGGISDG